MDLLCTWITGPDAGQTVHLAPGRHVVGRAPTADVRCADRAMQPHHALLELTAEGPPSITPLTGRVVVDGAAVEGKVEVAVGHPVELGHSRLQLAHGGTAPRTEATPRASAVVRTRRPPQPSPTLPPAAPPAPPTAEERPGGLLPAVVALAGSAALALVMGQAMFLLFGAIGSLVALASWGAQWTALARRAKRARAEHEAATALAAVAHAAARDLFAEARHAAAPGLATARRVVTESTSELWARRSTDPDAFTVSLGLGPVWWGDEQLADLPALAHLGPATRMAVTGPTASGLARAILVQLAAQCGPADVRIVVVTAQPDEWVWLRGLPHATLPDGVSAVVSDDELPEALATLVHPGLPEGETGVHILLVTDHAPWLAARTSQLRRALHGSGCALLAVLAHEVTVPHWCTSVATTTTGPHAGWVEDTATTLLPTRIRVAACGTATAAEVVAALEPRTDPEDPLGTATAMPRLVGLGRLLGETATSAHTIRAGWNAAVATGAPAVRTMLGMAADGAVDIDLVRDGPHGLVAGTTGAGKSELLRSLVAGLAVGLPPSHLTFVLVDYKGGATFDACARLPHVVGVVTDLDDQLADRALRSLHAELRRRERLLREHAAADLADLWTTRPEVVLPRLVVVIDEFAALVAEQPAFLHALVGVAQRGRSLGVHLILATQRPAGVISDDIRANTNLRIALRLQDASEAIDVVGDRMPATLSRTLPGRAVLRLGPGEHVLFQAATCTVAEAADTTDLGLIVDRIVDAARRSGSAMPPAPWCPPLPTAIPARSLPPGSTGLIDDPDAQQQYDLQWHPANGGLLVAGANGSGLSSAMALLGTTAITAGHRVLALARGEGVLTCPGAEVVSVGAAEALLRLLHHLRQPLARPTVLLLHEVEILRRLLDQPETAPLLDALDSIVDGSGLAGHGEPLCVVAGVRQPSALPPRLTQPFAQRWVLHLTDPHEGAVVGAAAGSTPPAIPGRALILPRGLHAQLSLPDVDAAGATGRVVRLLPTAEPAALPAGAYRDGVCELPFAVEIESGEVALLRLGDGDHALVAGPARSGRSSSLAVLASAWREAAAGVVVAVLPRRSPVGQLADVVHDRRGVGDAVAAVEAAALEGPVLLLIDDADLVDDPSGALTALLTRPPHGVLALVAGRSEALRSTYGHWTTPIRRSRLGLVHTGGSELDGDLFGVVLPRRSIVRPRPGLVWLSDGGAPRLAQVQMQMRAQRATTVEGACASRLATR